METSQDPVNQIVANWKDHIYENVSNYGTAAYDSYKRKGKGVLVIYFCNAQTKMSGLAAQIPVDYMTLNDPRVKKNGGWPVDNIPDIVGRCDFESQFVVLAIISEKESHACRLRLPQSKESRDRDIVNAAIFGGKGH